jgi:hypothetical protein
VISGLSLALRQKRLNALQHEPIRQHAAIIAEEWR